MHRGGKQKQGGRKAVYVREGGGVGQTARNRGTRGHEVSAEIKKKERKPPCKQPRDGGERVDVAGERLVVLLACFGSNTKHLWLCTCAGLRLWFYFRNIETKHGRNRFNKITCYSCREREGERGEGKIGLRLGVVRGLGGGVR